MPQDTPDAISPLAPFEGSYPVPGFELTRRWFDARDLTPEQSAEILSLISAAFNDRAIWFALPVAREDHFDWKFRDRPTGVTAHTTVDADGHIVGFTGGMHRVWLLRGRPYVSRGGYDLSLHPSWQRKGVQRAIQPFAEREWHPSEDIGVGYVTHPADRHLALESGNRAIANETHDYIRPLRPLQRVREFASRVRGGGSRAGSPAASNTATVIRGREQGRVDRGRRLAGWAARYARSLVARRSAPREVRWTISTLRQFDERHEPFVAAALRQFDFVAERSLAYLNWRYCDERAGPFTVRLAEEDGEPLGYAVTRVLDGSAYLADILALPGRADVAESLIRDALELAEAGDASFLRTRLPRHHPYSGALVRTGFFDIGHFSGEMVRERRVPASDLALLDDERTAVHLVMADSDYI